MGRRIATSAALIMLGNVASRLLGLAREQTIAALFGTTAAASIFSAASRVPTMVYDLLIGGAITAALVPVFSEYAARDERRSLRSSSELRVPRSQVPASRLETHRRAPPPEAAELGTLAGAVVGLTLTVLVPVAAALVLLARPLMSVLGVGFKPAVQARGILLVRLALPAVVLLGCVPKTSLLAGPATVVMLPLVPVRPFVSVAVTVWSVPAVVLVVNATVARPVASVVVPLANEPPLVLLQAMVFPLVATGLA
jgi:hypothetical protein